jgi:hypothetical protein
MDESLEHLSDHPLFRALVLMGGGIALSCGGIAEGGPASTGNGAAGAASSAAGASSSGSSGATTILVAVPGSAGTPSFAGGPSVATPEPDCPYAQWDCTAIEPVCYLSLFSFTDPVASKCFCDSKRPLTANDCGKGQSLICLEAFWQDGTRPGTWDGSVHVQCSCTAAQATGEQCNNSCDDAFPEDATIQGGERIFRCALPSNTTCGDNGTCTATSADVLRQDGIMCGCADIGLK